MFVITNNLMDHSRTSPRSLRGSWESSGVRMFFFIVPLGDLEINSAVPLRDLADDTGGSILDWPGAKGDPFANEGVLNGYVCSALGTALIQLYEQMIESERLEILLTNPLERPTDLKLTLMKQESRQLKVSKVVYAHELAPCGVTQPK